MEICGCHFSHSSVQPESKSFSHEIPMKIASELSVESPEGWQVVDGAPHLLGARVEALDAEGRSLLREGSAVTVQGAAAVVRRL